jgi:hypothetical protein
VRLAAYADYHHIETDERKHDGDVVEVQEGRARALIQQGYVVPAEDNQRSKRKYQDCQQRVGLCREVAPRLALTAWPPLSSSGAVPVPPNASKAQGLLLIGPSKPQAYLIS